MLNIHDQNSRILDDFIPQKQISTSIKGNKHLSAAVRIHV